MYKKQKLNACFFSAMESFFLQENIELNITKCEVNRDCSQVKVFCLNEITGMNSKFASKARKHLAHIVHKKRIPQVRFVSDKEMLRQQRLDTILKMIKSTDDVESSI